MKWYTVVLEIRHRGSACGSTTDQIEAESEEEAVENAIAEWRKLRPDRTFVALFSAPVPGQRGEDHMSGRVRIIARSPGDVFVVCEGDELPTGPYDPHLYLPVRRYDLRLDRLSEAAWLGAWMKFLGAYMQESRLGDAETERRIIDRVEELLRDEL